LSICDFCLEFETGGQCRLGLKLPKRMSCREFGPTLDKFCSNPNDFVDPGQLVQMATYFGMKGPELKKVRAMAALAESSRL
jgi:hypothetical protein